MSNNHKKLGQAEGSQGEREVTPNPSCSMCSGNGYFCEFSTVETCWCCLPEPEPEETVEALKERIESLKAVVTHMKQQRDAAVARAAPVAPAPAALPPFAEKVLAKLRRFQECAEDFESGGVDIGRHWLDLLTQLVLLNRVQRSPALWEISQQGEDLLEAPVSQAGQVPEGYMVLQTASLSHVLGLVEGAMEDAYGNAFQVCCGKGSGGECRGDPEAGWSPEDQRTMDVLNPIQRELRAMLDATPAQGGRDE